MRAVEHTLVARRLIRGGNREHIDRKREKVGAESRVEQLQKRVTPMHDLIGIDAQLPVVGRVMAADESLSLIRPSRLPPVEHRCTVPHSCCCGRIA